MANEKEVKRWNDEQWVEAWPKREQLTDALTPHLLAVVSAVPGQRVCDIGCGGGGQTIPLAQAVSPGGHVVGLDISAPLLELARARTAEAGVSNVEYIVRDVQTDGLGAEQFDLAVSKLGVMFFDEPTAAFSAIRAGLRPGGRFVFACWQWVDKNPWHTGTVFRRFLPSPPAPGPGKSPVGPFSLGDDEYARDVLGGAGFSDVIGSPVEITVRGPASAVAAERSLLGFMGVGPEQADEVTAALDEHVEQFAVGDGVYEYPVAFRIYEAVNA